MSELKARKARQNALILRAQAGDEAAMEQLLRETQGLVLKHARYYAGQTTMAELEDFIQAGRLAVVHACRKFDCARGLAFTTYAHYWIQQMMRRAFDKGHLIHIPVHVQQAARAGGYCEDLPIATRCLDILLTDNEDDRLIDVMVSDDDTESQAIGDSEMTIALRQAVAALKSLERTVLTLRFGLDGSGTRTLREVADEIGYSREGVRHIQRRALCALKQLLGG